MWWVRASSLDRMEFRAEGIGYVLSSGAMVGRRSQARR